METKIYEWEAFDENGWRMIELWRVDGELELRAFDQDGGDVNNGFRCEDCNELCGNMTSLNAMKHIVNIWSLNNKESNQPH